MEPATNASERALNRLEQFHKNQKELENQRRKKRNVEVDQLISQLADPKVAEKLRIYRLVEEQFDHIETEVEKQVKAEIEAKKKAKKQPLQHHKEPPKSSIAKSPAKLLEKARKLRMELAQELETDEPPEPLKGNLKRLEEERKIKAKEKLLSRSVRGPVEKVVYQPKKIDQIPTKPLNLIKAKSQVGKKLPKKNQTSPIVMLSKPIVRDITDQERRDLTPKRNVGYVAFEHNEEEVEEKKSSILSAHTLGGINISPIPNILFQPKKPTPNVKIVHEIFSGKEDEEATKEPTESHEALEESAKSIDEIDSETSTKSRKEVETVQERKPTDDTIETLVQKVETTEPIEVKVDEVEEYYSDDFEEDNAEDILKEFIPKVIAMRDFADEDSVASGRLSTILEVTSQAATSVENSKKETPLEEGPLSSSSQSSSIITSPIHKPTIQPTPAPKQDNTLDESLAKLSLSEGPILAPSDDASISSFVPELNKDKVSMSGDQIQLEHKALPKPTSNIDQNVTSTVPDLDLTASEQSSTAAKNMISSSSSTTSSAMVSTSPSTSLQMSSFSKTESEFSEGQVLVFRHLTSEGEVNFSEEEAKRVGIMQISSNSEDFTDLSHKDSLEEGEVK